MEKTNNQLAKEIKSNFKEFMDLVDQRRTTITKESDILVQNNIAEGQDLLAQLNTLKEKEKNN